MNPAADPAAMAGAISWLHVLLAFAITGGLLAALGFGLKYLSLHGLVVPRTASGKQRRLQLVETLPLDARHRLALVKCDGVESLLLLGMTQDVVVRRVVRPAAISLADSEL